MNLPRKAGRRWLLGLLGAMALVALVPLSAYADFTLINGTAVLYTNTGSSSGNGGNTSSTTSSTNIFAPASYVDYHEFGGEPTTVVDRYPFAPGTFGNNTTDNQYRDLIYVTNPLGVGFPGFSEFYKSSDGGQTFHVPLHDPLTEPDGFTGSGGGDSHVAVGQFSHYVFLVDLSGYCLTMNISHDLGETWLSKNQLGCEANPGVIDDRQWVAADETGGLQNVYVNVNNDTGCLATNQPGCYIAFIKSTDDGGANTALDWAGSTCTLGTAPARPPSNPDATPTACPDPFDPNFWIAGPVTVDTSSASHNWHSLYIPFERNYGGNDFQLWVAISRDQGDHWIRQQVADLGPHDSANIFPELTVDSGGNLYYTWSQAQGHNANTPADEGETDVYYTYSQDAGGTWVTPIDLTNEVGDSAVFPWMVAGSTGQVDLVLYKANTGLNPNIAYYDQNGQSCDPSNVPAGSTCTQNTTVWNTYFGQSQNALNSGKNFKIVQISDHPIHIGGVCTQGIACQSGAAQNRDLLDFLTVDIDHTGAAYTTWADDNNSRHDTRQFFSRQLAGASILPGQSIAAMNSYPITDHSVTDPMGDVLQASGAPEGTCPGMDLVGTSEKQTNGILTVTLTLEGPPTAATAIGCSGVPTQATGGLWGAEFWSSSTVTGPPSEYPNGNFYIAYRDNPPDGAPGSVEAGQVNELSATFTHDEFTKYESGTLGGTCLTSPSTPNPAAPTPCTIILTAPLSGLGIKSGAGLYSISGFSTYFFGTEQSVPFTRVATGNTNLADIATPFDDNGTGTTTK